MTPPEISVIVLNHNGRTWLGPCLNALERQTVTIAFERIVVDNASTDGSAQFVRDSYRGVTVVENASNLGFAAGNNTGARAARGEWLVFLNNDTVADQDWLAHLHAAARERADCQLIASRVVFLDDSIILDSAGDGYFRAGGAFKRGHGAPASGYPRSEEVFGACGAALMIRRDVFDALGGFDERFFMVYEDVDLSYRARLVGHRCWYAADAVVRHAGSATLGVASRRAIFYGQRNLEWTWVKNSPLPLLLRTLLPHAVYSASGLLHYARLGLLSPALKGKWAALAGLPSVIADRRRIQRLRRVGADDLDRVMTRGWIAIKRREKAARGPA